MSSIRFTIWSSTISILNFSRALSGIFRLLRISPVEILDPLYEIGIGVHGNVDLLDIEAAHLGLQILPELQEEVELPSIYFSHTRKVFERDGMLLAIEP